MLKFNAVICWVICFVLATHGGMRLLSNAQQLSQIHLSTDDDIELICTGKTMKWISVSLSEQAQRFVFVKAPKGFEKLDVQNLCPSVVLTDHTYTLDVNAISIIAQYVAFRALVSELAQRPYTSFAYLTAESRAPPIIS